MNLERYVKQLESHKFDFELRTNLRFNQQAYKDLLKILIKLEYELKNEQLISKALALNLYSIVNVVRNSLDFLKKNKPESELTQKVEDAWIEIDNLVLNCLTDS